MNHLLQFIELNRTSGPILAVKLDRSLQTDPLGKIRQKVRSRTPLVQLIMHIRQYVPPCPLPISFSQPKAATQFSIVRDFFSYWKNDEPEGSARISGHVDTLQCLCWDSCRSARTSGGSSLSFTSQTRLSTCVLWWSNTMLITSSLPAWLNSHIIKRMINGNKHKLGHAR